MPTSHVVLSWINVAEENKTVSNKCMRLWLAFSDRFTSLGNFR